MECSGAGVAASVHALGTTLHTTEQRRSVLDTIMLDLLRSNFPILRPSQGTLLRPSGLILVWSSGIVFTMRYAFSFLLSFPVLAIRLTT